MLKINEFYWRLYKESPEGKKTIERFEALNSSKLTSGEFISLLKDFNPERLLAETEESLSWDYKTVYRNLASMCKYDEHKTERENLYSLIHKFFGKTNQDYRDALSRIEHISFFLYSVNPSYYIPYLFVYRYKYLRQILEDYDLDILEVPGKASYEERCMYYLDICEALNKFKMFNRLSNAELLAFIYDMERKRYDATYGNSDGAFPQVWLISGRKQGKEVNAKIMPWQANAATKKGDILFFYETGETSIKAHQSCLTGIWTAETDGMSDPFFYYYESAIISNEIKIEPIPFKVLAGDSRTEKLPRLGANFLGIKGDAISTKTYEGLLELIEERDPSFDRTLLPQLYKPFEAKVKFEDRGAMKPEQWVEEYLVKELLEQMGWKNKDVDYRRQVHLRMGRPKIEGEKTQDGRTDFSLFPFGPKLKNADVLIEVKAPGEMDGKDIEKTFWQAESYASHQYANLIILADGDKVLLFPKGKDGTFKYSNNPESYTWAELFANVDDKFIS